jgi:hypothetical protein
MSSMFVSIYMFAYANPDGIGQETDACRESACVNSVDKLYYVIVIEMNLFRSFTWRTR